MKLQFCDVEQWLSESDEQIFCDISTYVVRDKTNFLVKIRPFLSLCRNLIVLGGDWIPVRANGVSLIEQMVHTPSIYFGKAKNIGWADNSYFANIDSVKEFSGDAVLVGGDTNYYHWLIDFLPRLLLARKYADLSGRHIIVNKTLTPFQSESLGLLGINDHQLLLIGDDEAVQPRTTLVPSLMASTTVPHPALLKLMQEAFPKSRNSSCERVYLSRQDATSRRLSNEEELMGLLAKYGFETHTPSSLSFQEQIDLSSGAKALVAVHGAAMANLVFCPAATKVFEIFSPHHQATFMYMLSRICKRRHRFIPAKNLSFGNDGNPLLGTWEVDLESMDSALRAEFG